MGWGSAIANVYHLASDTAKVAASQAAQSAKSAYDYAERKALQAVNAAQEGYTYAKQKAGEAYDYGEQKAVETYDYGKHKAIEGAALAKSAAIAAKDAAVSGAALAYSAAERVAIEARYLEAIGPAAIAQKAYTAVKGSLSDKAPGSIQPCPHRTAECNKLRDALEKAMLADEAYEDNQGKYPDKGGYRRLDPEDPNDLERLKSILGSHDPKSLLKNADNDFLASIFVRGNPNGKEDIVISYRGTVTDKNWEDNIRQGIGRVNPNATDSSYNNAMALAKQADAAARLSGNMLSYTGHSLGGGLASAAAVVTKRPANTYNSAGLHANTLPYGYPDPPVEVNAYYAPSDPLSAIQDHRELALGGAAAGLGLLSPSASAALVAYLAGNELAGTPLAPRAYGTRHPMPFPDDQELKPIGPVEGHRMPLLIAGIRKEQGLKGCT